MPSGKRWGSGARLDNPDKGKEMLLRAALNCLINKGLKDTTVEDVAAAANVTRRTVYRYYSGKDEIISAVLDYGRSYMFARMREQVEPYTNDLARLVEECIIFAATFQPPQQGQTDLVSGGNFERAQPHVFSEKAIREWRRILRESYKQHVARHGAIGELDDLIEIIARLALGYRHARMPPERIRVQIQSFALLSRRRN